jgi:hypothetical protein
VAISDPATAHFTAYKNLENTSIAYKPMAGSLIATGVWLASRVYVYMHPDKWLCG